MALLQIYADKIGQNVRAVKALVENSGVDIAAVTKVFCGDPVLARIIIDNGVSLLADSRLSNLARLRRLPGRRMLLRAPALREAAQAVALADITLVSHGRIVRALSEAAGACGKSHDVILMLDTGDLREGVVDPQEAFDIALLILGLPNIRLAGLGVNYCCMAHVAPTPENLAPAERLKERIETSCGVALPVVSGGNSSSLSLLLEGELPGYVNQLRIGEAIALGRETVHGRDIPGGYRDCFTLSAEIIELREKPVPKEKPESGGLEWRLRALCSLGRQDVHPGDIVPVDKRIKIAGASSDHLALDMQSCRGAYALGDNLSFRMNYAGLLSLMASRDIEREYL